MTRTSFSSLVSYCLVLAWSMAGSCASPQARDDEFGRAIRVAAEERLDCAVVDALWKERTDKALARAGSNRAELEQVLDHYRATREELKLDAAHFLIANMDGRGYVTTVLKTEKGEEIDFDPLKHKDFAAAQAAYDVLEKQHGTLDYKRKDFFADPTTIKAAMLLRHIEWAFKAWRERPWGTSVDLETFKNYVLPYRGSEEPVEDWRAPLFARMDDVPGLMKNPTDGREAAAIIRKRVDSIIGFNEIYYLHPTDQGYAEMVAHKLGRCEDITNMCLYAWRANAIPCASDYTPMWANRDNNHAWESVLIGKLDTGVVHGSARAAKVFRKEFAIQPEALGNLVDDPKKAPPWLRGKAYRDVTDQYLETSDITIPLDAGADPSDGSRRFAYLCVFNGGQWVPVHHGIRQVTGSGSEADSRSPRQQERGATFTKMGRRIAYLAAWYVDEKIVPASDPFVVDDHGATRFLGAVDRHGATAAVQSVEISVLTPSVSDPDTHADKPHIRVEAGKTYELFAWGGTGADAGWKSIGKAGAEEGKPVSFDNVPVGRLYWMKADDSRGLERIFTIESGQVVYW